MTILKEHCWVCHKNQLIDIEKARDEKDGSIVGYIGRCKNCGTHLITANKDGRQLLCDHGTIYYGEKIIN